MITEATLEWQGFNLYRVSGTRREFVGTIMSDPFSTTWTVWKRGEEVKTSYISESDARDALERMA